MKLNNDYGRFNDLIEKLEGDGNSYRPYRSSEVSSIDINNDEVSHYVEFVANLPEYGCFMISNFKRSGIGSYYGGLNSDVIAYANKVRIYNDKVVAIMNNKIIYENDKHHIRGNYDNSELIINIQYKHLK